HPKKLKPPETLPQTAASHTPRAVGLGKRHQPVGEQPGLVTRPGPSRRPGIGVAPDLAPGDAWWESRSSRPGHGPGRQREESGRITTSRTFTWARACSQ